MGSSRRRLAQRLESTAAAQVQARRRPSRSGNDAARRGGAGAGEEKLRGGGRMRWGSPSPEKGGFDGWLGRRQTGGDGGSDEERQGGVAFFF
jgi:hypothetical protein